MCAVVGVPAETPPKARIMHFSPRHLICEGVKKKKSCLVNILLRGEQEEVVEGENLYQ